MGTVGSLNAGEHVLFKRIYHVFDDPTNANDNLYCLGQVVFADNTQSTAAITAAKLVNSSTGDVTSVTLTADDFSGPTKLQAFLNDTDYVADATAARDNVRQIFLQRANSGAADLAVGTYRLVVQIDGKGSDWYPVQYTDSQNTHEFIVIRGNNMAMHGFAVVPAATYERNPDDAGDVPSWFSGIDAVNSVPASTGSCNLIEYSPTSVSGIPTLPVTLVRPEDELSAGCPLVIVRVRNGNPYLVRTMDLEFSDVTGMSVDDEVTLSSDSSVIIGTVTSIDAANNTIRVTGDCTIDIPTVGTNVDVGSVTNASVTGFDVIRDRFQFFVAGYDESGNVISLSGLSTRFIASAFVDVNDDAGDGAVDAVEAYYGVYIDPSSLLPMRSLRQLRVEAHDKMGQTTIMSIPFHIVNDPRIEAIDTPLRLAGEDLRLASIKNREFLARQDGTAPNLLPSLVPDEDRYVLEVQNTNYANSWSINDELYRDDGAGGIELIGQLASWYEGKGVLVLDGGFSNTPVIAVNDVIGKDDGAGGITASDVVTAFTEQTRTYLPYHSIQWEYVNRQHLFRVTVPNSYRGQYLLPTNIIDDSTTPDMAWTSFVQYTDSGDSNVEVTLDHPYAAVLYASSPGVGTSTILTARHLNTNLDTNALVTQSDIAAWTFEDSQPGVNVWNSMNFPSQPALNITDVKCAYAVIRVSGANKISQRDLALEFRGQDSGSNTTETFALSASTMLDANKYYIVYAGDTSPLDVCESLGWYLDRASEVLQVDDLSSASAMDDVRRTIFMVNRADFTLSNVTGGTIAVNDIVYSDSGLTSTIGTVTNVDGSNVSIALDQGQTAPIVSATLYFTGGVSADVDADNSIELELYEGGIVYEDVTGQTQKDRLRFLPDTKADTSAWSEDDIVKDVTVKATLAADLDEVDRATTVLEPIDLTPPQEFEYHVRYIIRPSGASSNERVTRRRTLRVDDTSAHPRALPSVYFPLEAVPQETERTLSGDNLDIDVVRGTDFDMGSFKRVGGVQAVDLTYADVETSVPDVTRIDPDGAGTDLVVRPTEDQTLRAALASASSSEYDRILNGSSLTASQFALTTNDNVTFSSAFGANEAQLDIANYLNSVSLHGSDDEEAPLSLLLRQRFMDSTLGVLATVPTYAERTEVTPDLNGVRVLTAINATTGAYEVDLIASSSTTVLSLALRVPTVNWEPLILRSDNGTMEYAWAASMGSSSDLSNLSDYITASLVGGNAYYVRFTIARDTFTKFFNGVRPSEVLWTVKTGSFSSALDKSLTASGWQNKHPRRYRVKVTDGADLLDVARDYVVKDSTNTTTLGRVLAVVPSEAVAQIEFLEGVTIPGESEDLNIEDGGGSPVVTVTTATNGLDMAVEAMTPSHVALFKAQTSSKQSVNFYRHFRVSATQRVLVTLDNDYSGSISVGDVIYQDSNQSRAIGDVVSVDGADIVVALYDGEAVPSVSDSLYIGSGPVTVVVDSLTMDGVETSTDSIISMYPVALRLPRAGDNYADAGLDIDTSSGSDLQLVPLKANTNTYDLKELQSGRSDINKDSADVWTGASRDDIVDGGYGINFTESITLYTASGNHSFATSADLPDAHALVAADMGLAFKDTDSASKARGLYLDVANTGAVYNDELNSDDDLQKFYGHIGFMNMPFTPGYTSRGVSYNPSSQYTLNVRHDIVTLEKPRIFFGRADNNKVRTTLDSAFDGDVRYISLADAASARFRDGFVGSLGDDDYLVAGLQMLDSVEGNSSASKAFQTSLSYFGGAPGYNTSLATSSNSSNDAMRPAVSIDWSSVQEIVDMDGTDKTGDAAFDGSSLVSTSIANITKDAVNMNMGVTFGATFSSTLQPGSIYKVTATVPTANTEVTITDEDGTTHTTRISSLWNAQTRDLYFGYTDVTPISHVAGNTSSIVQAANFLCDSGEVLVNTRRQYDDAKYISRVPAETEVFLEAPVKVTQTLEKARTKFAIVSQRLGTQSAIEGAIRSMLNGDNSWDDFLDELVTPDLVVAKLAPTDTTRADKRAKLDAQQANRNRGIEIDADATDFETVFIADRTYNVVDADGIVYEETNGLYRLVVVDSLGSYKTYDMELRSTADIREVIFSWTKNTPTEDVAKRSAPDCATFQVDEVVLNRMGTANTIDDVVDSGDNAGHLRLARNGRYKVTFTGTAPSDGQDIEMTTMEGTNMYGTTSTGTITVENGTEYYLRVTSNGWIPTSDMVLCDANDINTTYTLDTVTKCTLREIPMDWAIQRRVKETLHSIELISSISASDWAYNTPIYSDLAKTTLVGAVIVGSGSKGLVFVKNSGTLSSSNNYYFGATPTMVALPTDSVPATEHIVQLTTSLDPVNGTNPWAIDRIVEDNSSNVIGVVMGGYGTRGTVYFTGTLPASGDTIVFKGFSSGDLTADVSKVLADTPIENVELTSSDEGYYQGGSNEDGGITSSSFVTVAMPGNMTMDRLNEILEATLFPDRAPTLGTSDDGYAAATADYERAFEYRVLASNGFRDAVKAADYRLVYMTLPSDWTQGTIVQDSVLSIDMGYVAYKESPTATVGEVLLVGEAATTLGILRDRQYDGVLPDGSTSSNSLTLGSSDTLEGAGLNSERYYSVTLAAYDGSDATLGATAMFTDDGSGGASTDNQLGTVITDEDSGTFIVRLEDNAVMPSDGSTITMAEPGNIMYTPTTYTATTIELIALESGADLDNHTSVYMASDPIETSYTNWTDQILVSGGDAVADVTTPRYVKSNFVLSGYTTPSLNTISTEPAVVRGDPTRNVRYFLPDALPPILTVKYGASGAGGNTVQNDGTETEAESGVNNEFQWVTE